MKNIALNKIDMILIEQFYIKMEIRPQYEVKFIGLIIIRYK